MQKLVIDRSKWLRGEGSEKSFLLRKSDGKMCCVGIYMKSLGFKPSELQNNGTVVDLMWDDYDANKKRFKQRKCEWLESHDTVNSLYMTNDDENIDEDTREAKIVEGFAKHDVKVTFVDKVKRTVKRVVKKARRKVKR